MILRVALALAAVIVATTVLVGADADLTFAVVVLLLVVAGASVLGYATGLTAARQQRRRAQLLLHATGALVPHRPARRHPGPGGVRRRVGARRRDHRPAQRAPHARRRCTHAKRRLRVTLTHELRRGVDIAVVLRRLAAELVSMFDLTACAVTVRDGDTARPTAGSDVLIESPPLLVRVTPGLPLRSRRPRRDPRAGRRRRHRDRARASRRRGTRATDPRRARPVARRRS